ncbi:MAG: AbrB/MazE/SpoVT family DNA-binding domain-containing protein [Oscillospiraceae bacterium]|nr:AbrB/MazE/SpoVT family DNA-binding domain-containing protein [Oscillospiraceae bacterium]
MKPKRNKFIGICTVGEKGQIVIPKAAREMFGIVPGDSVLVLCDRKRGMAIVKADAIEPLADKILDRQSGMDEEEEETA